MNALASILQGDGSEWSAPASAAAAAANIAGPEEWLTWHILPPGAAAGTQDMLSKGNLLDPLHGTMGRRNCNLSVEDKAWSWLMDAGEWMKEMWSQFPVLSFG